MGTKDGEILEVGEKNAASNLLLDSHARGGIWGLTAHPAKEVCVTASDDATIRLWDLADKVGLCPTPFAVQRGDVPDVPDWCAPSLDSSRVQASAPAVTSAVGLLAPPLTELTVAVATSKANDTAQSNHSRRLVVTLVIWRPLLAVFYELYL